MLSLREYQIKSDKFCIFPRAHAPLEIAIWCYVPLGLVYHAPLITTEKVLYFNTMPSLPFFSLCRSLAINMGNQQLLWTTTGAVHPKKGPSFSCQLAHLLNKLTHHEPMKA